MSGDAVDPMAVALTFGVRAGVEQALRDAVLAADRRTTCDCVVGICSEGGECCESDDCGESPDAE